MGFDIGVQGYTFPPLVLMFLKVGMQKGKGMIMLQDRPKTDEAQSYGEIFYLNPTLSPIFIRSRAGSNLIIAEIKLQTSQN